MTANVTFKFIGDDSNLRKSTKRASSELEKLGGKLKASFSPANLLGPVAAAASLQQLVSVVTDATKIYFEDQKSLASLNNVIDNNTDANIYQKQAVDDTIQSLSLMSAVADDDLRSAMSKLVVATGDVDKAQKLLRLSLDVSAGSGKDLASVSAAIAKASTGSYGALKKLIPGVDATSAAFDQLAASYDGAAEVAGANDPFGQMQIVMEQLNETLGAQFAPLLQDFLAYLQSDEGKGAIDGFKTSLVGLGDVMKGLKEAGSFLGPISDFIKNTNAFSPQSLISWLQVLGGQSQTTANQLNQTSVSIRGIEHAAASITSPGSNTNNTTKNLKKIPEAIKNAAKEIKEAGKSWASSLDLASGLSEDKTSFDATSFMEKMRAVVSAAKALPAKLRALRKAGASPEMLQQIIAMGPQEGLATATGFLASSGSAKEYSKSMQTLSSLGSSTMANVAGQQTYEININKANMTAEEIISAIQKYQKKTGKKVNFGNG